MWRILLATGLLLGLGIGPASAQEWSGTAALGLSGGHQTNLYLDPVLGTWNPDAPSAFLAVTPRVGLTRAGRRTRIDLTVRGRVYARRADIPQHTQSTFRLRRRVAPDWTLGVVGGGVRYRYPASQQSTRTVRDSWWVLPAVRWTPTSETMLTLRTGLTQRFEQLPTLTDRQTSGLASLRATRWLTDRVQGGLSLYYSGGRTSTFETGFGGTGGTLSATYWPTDAVSVRGEVALEQLRYETLRPSGLVRDEIGRVGLEVEWTPRSSLTLFGRARSLYAALDAGDRRDVHLSAGLRLRVRRSLGSTVEAPPRRRVCADTENGLRLRVPYDGEGTPHVTGDFNGWSLPGVPLEPTDGNAWQTTLDLPPGRYAYRLRVVEDGGEARWLDLPGYAQTAEDAFGGTNGVCTVQ